MDRVFNAALGQDVLERAGPAMAAPGAFDGARERSALSARQRPGIAPATRLTDYDSSGRPLPGRFVAKSLRIEPVPMPPGMPDPVRGFTYVVNGLLHRYVAPSLKAAVNRLTRNDIGIEESVWSRACPPPDKKAPPPDFGVLSWIRRIAADKAKRLVNW